MPGISYVDIGVGLYSCGVVAKDLVSWGSSVRSVLCESKEGAVFRNVLSSSVSLVASSSWMALWIQKRIIHFEKQPLL